MIETTVGIDGMQCGMCEAHVNDTIRAAFPVKKVSASHKKGQAVILSEEEIPEEALKEAVKKIGYEVTCAVSEKRTVSPVKINRITEKKYQLATPIFPEKVV